MIVYSELKKFFKTQAALANVIGGGETTRAARIKASRIWRGLRKPTDTEVVYIHKASNGLFDANYFNSLLGRTKVKKPRSN